MSAAASPSSSAAAPAAIATAANVATTDSAAAPSPRRRRSPLRFPAAIAAFAVAASALCSCSTPRETYDKAFANGDYEKAFKTGMKEISAAPAAASDTLEWQLLAASGAQLARRPADALAAYNRADELIRLLDDADDARARDTAALAEALLAAPASDPYAAADHERIMAATYKALAQLELRDFRAARATLATVLAARDAVLTRDAATNASRAAALANARVRLAPAIGDPAPYFDATRFIQQHVNDPAFRGYGDNINPFTIYLAALAALFDRDPKPAIEGLKAAAAAIPRNGQVAREAAHFAKNPDVSNRVCVIIENGLSPRLREIRFADSQRLPATARAAQSGADIPPVQSGSGGSPVRPQPAPTPQPPAAETYLARLEFALPVLEPVNSSHTGFRANVPGRETPLYSEVLANMDAIVRAEYNRDLPALAARETTRALVRAALRHAPVEGSPAIPPPAADTRHWRALPKDIHLITFNMSPSERTFTLSSTDGDRAIPVTIPPCRNAIILLRVPAALSYAPPPRILTFD